MSEIRPQRVQFLPDLPDFLANSRAFGQKDAEKYTAAAPLQPMPDTSGTSGLNRTALQNFPSPYNAFHQR